MRMLIQQNIPNDFFFAEKKEGIITRIIDFLL